ncbi:MAG TPA: hypothetical protein ENN19_14635, partial [Chloroflexi bacterium]|nr:hypothetical protein [Chloroflexota bacterium]
RWSFPEGLTLAARGYLLLFASGQPAVPPYRDGKGYYHTNFKLSKDGEYLALLDDEDQVIHAYDEFEYAPGRFGYPPQEENISYGVFYGHSHYFAAFTPGQANRDAKLGIVADTRFSLDRGVYARPADGQPPLTVALSCETPEATIRYTLDGSTPTGNHGLTYAQPIVLDRTMVIRAAAFKPGWLPSNVDTHTYIFPEDVIHQTHPGGDWPRGSVNGQVIDIGMDAAVVNDSRYAGQMVDALTAIPSMCLVTDLPNLFDPSIGIYVNASRQGRDWERPASLELIHPDGAEGFQVDCGVRIRGGYSRSSRNPKHAFRFFFRKEYGPGKLRYPLFGDEGVDAFDNIDLRCSQNYSWSFEHDSRNTMCREVFSRDTQRDMGQPYTRSRYYHLYINGVYWGIFQSQERSEASFGKSYFGGDKDDYDTVKVEAGPYTVWATDGNLDAWRHVHNVARAGFTNNEPYFRLMGLNSNGTFNPAYPRYLDVDNLIDYMICTYYVGDFDGPISDFLGNTRPNNFYGIFNRRHPEGFKFFRHDAEHSLFTHRGWDRTGPWPAGDQFQYFNPQWLHQQLTQNAEYRLRFADRVHKHFFHNGALTPEAAKARLAARAQQIELAIIAESARWGNLNLTQATWQYQIDSLLNTYFPGRTQTVLGQFRSKGWYPNIDAPQISPRDGILMPTQNLTLTNPNVGGEIYYTLDGTDPRVSPGQPGEGTATSLINDATPRFVKVPTEPLAALKGSVVAEYFFGVSDGSIAALKAHPGWPDQPDQTQTLTSFEIPTDWNDNYGTRIGAYLHPTQTGDYTFWISSDDNSELWLSTDASPANASRIAYVPGWTDSRQWTKYSEQRSAAIRLEAGGTYYIEALMAEGTGGDNLAVAWRRGWLGSRQVIDGSYLSSAKSNWILPGFDHSGWRSGTGPVGYETRPGDPINFSDVIGIDVGTDMIGKNATCLVRIPFTFSGGDVTSLALSVRYDDG